MPKVSSCTLELNEKRKSFEIHYSTLPIEYADMKFGFLVVEEVSIEGEQPAFLDENGRAQNIYSQDTFKRIPWTAEREAFFSQTQQKLTQAFESIQRFLKEAEEQPALFLDAAIARGALMLEGGAK